MSEKWVAWKGIPYLGSPAGKMGIAMVCHRHEFLQRGWIVLIWGIVQPEDDAIICE